MSANGSLPSIMPTSTRRPKSQRASLIPSEVVELSASPPEDVALRLKKQSNYTPSSGELSITGSRSARHFSHGQHSLEHIPLPEDCTGATLDDFYSASDRTFSRKRCRRRQKRPWQDVEPGLSSKSYSSFNDLLQKRLKSSSREEATTEDKAGKCADPMKTSGTGDGGTKITSDRFISVESLTHTVRTSQSQRGMGSGPTTKKLSSDNARQKSSTTSQKSDTGRLKVDKISARHHDPGILDPTITEAGVIVRHSKSGNTHRTDRSDARSLLPTSHEDPPNPEESVVPAHAGEHIPHPQPVYQMALKECLLYPLAGCLLSGFIVVCALLLFPVEKLGRERARALSTKMCVSPGCLQTAKYLNSLLSWKSADTCEDFYALVCRRWTSSYDAAGAKEYPMSFDDDYETYLEYRMYAMIQDQSQQSSSGLNPVRALHEKCMNTRRIEEGGWNPLLELMFEVSLEGFPLTPPVRSSISVWEIAAKVLRRTGSCALLGVRVTSKTSHYDSGDVLSVLPPDMISEGADINQAIKIYTSAFFSALKVLRKEYLPPNNSFSVVKFATDVERLAEAKLWRSSSVIHVLKAPSPLLQFFVEIFHDVKSALFTGEGSEVRMVTPHATNKVLDLVREAETHTVLNYIGVRLMIETSAFLPNADLTDFESTYLYARRRTNLPRWQLCLRVAEKALFPLVAVTLVKSLQKNASTAPFYAEVFDIVKAFQHGTNASPYFDAESRMAIRRLLSTVQFRVLGPDWVKDQTLVEQYIIGLPSVTSNASGLDSYVKAHEYTFLASLRRNSSQRWTRSIFSTHCWHELNPATVYVPVLLFNLTQQHSDDLNGLQLSRAGVRLNQCIFELLLDVAYSKQETGESWLTERTEKRMRAADACAYGPREEISPRFSTIRDILAARFAYAHFQRLAWDKMTRIRLADGREVTDEQLFFVYLMLQSCREIVDIETEQPRDGHNWEVALSISEDFLDAFNCSRRFSTSSQKCLL